MGEVEKFMSVSPTLGGMARGTAGVEPLSTAQTDVKAFALDRLSVLNTPPLLRTAPTPLEQDSFWQIINEMICIGRRLVYVSVSVCPNRELWPDRSTDEHSV
jgi:hypothetical protein